MTTKRHPPWTDQENAAIARLYFDMLNCAIWDKPYNKAAMIRTAQTGLNCNCYTLAEAVLPDRSRGSIEAKLMNCSAVHAAIDSEAVTMDGYGYRALANYQASLINAIRDELTKRDPHFIRDHAEASA